MRILSVNENFDFSLPGSPSIKIAIINKAIKLKRDFPNYKIFDFVVSSADSNIKFNLSTNVSRYLKSTKAMDNEQNFAKLIDSHKSLHEYKNQINTHGEKSIDWWCKTFSVDQIKELHKLKNIAPTSIGPWFSLLRQYCLEMSTFLKLESTILLLNLLGFSSIYIEELATDYENDSHLFEI